MDLIYRFNLRDLACLAFKHMETTMPKMFEQEKFSSQIRIRGESGEIFTDEISIDIEFIENDKEDSE